ncbi:hypothetical protein CONCODRAFT_79421 [Conidiobolus coronatus NRRL 28638]|uniref:L-type lectin-like domain-containing protein n=1 Tax=Conidiobolus coronatus (strain ATCC 28846 / CBS 209.66 / NRRL 28638) TaxID=796925 RepID=A0A137P2U5_CONC2|nr:hypothetical protein CONCODRAFT_79421 [Conidiobolus coronatus NRRL 28638]|eukprot:KXN69261.1 hypothetical protein CONCODRAFT_79421 [Conidiobolus coronatus NRRL 28638]
MRSIKLIYHIFSLYSVASQFKEETGKGDFEETTPHSLYPPFVNVFDIENWDFGGDAIVDTYSHIRLTPDNPSKSGYLWSKDYLPNKNWQVEFKFKVGGISKGLSGDGFAFWAARERAISGPVFGSKDYFNGLGIFFDTFHNAMTNDIEFPYISAQIGDGNMHYDNDQDGKPTEKSGCSYDFKNHNNVKAKITYVKDVSLELRLQKDDDDWTTCFAIPNVKLPENIYLGFSGLTGQLHDQHDINYVTTRVAENIGTYKADFASQPYVKHSSHWGKLFLIFVIVGVVALMYVGYQSQQKKARKRF